MKSDTKFCLEIVAVVLLVCSGIYGAYAYSHHRGQVAAQFVEDMKTYDFREGDILIHKSDTKMDQPFTIDTIDYDSSELVVSYYVKGQESGVKKVVTQYDAYVLISARERKAAMEALNKLNEEATGVIKASLESVKRSQERLRRYELDLKNLGRTR